MVSRKKVVVVKADGSGVTSVDFSTAALNDLRAGAEPGGYDWGRDRKYVLPEYVGNVVADAPGEISVDPVVQNAHPYQSGGN